VHLSPSGSAFGSDVLEQLLTTFDEAFLLNNDRFAQAGERALAEYRQAPFHRRSSPHLQCSPLQLATYRRSLPYRLSHFSPLRDAQRIVCLASGRRGSQRRHTSRI
jgi:hypothetical protein